MYVEFFYFKCVYFGQLVPENSISLTNYVNVQSKLWFLTMYRIKLQ